MFGNRGTGLGRAGAASGPVSAGWASPGCRVWGSHRLISPKPILSQVTVACNKPLSWLLRGFRFLGLAWLSFKCPRRIRTPFLSSRPGPETQSGVSGPRAMAPNSRVKRHGPPPRPRSTSTALTPVCPFPESQMKSIPDWPGRRCWLISAEI